MSVTNRTQFGYYVDLFDLSNHVKNDETFETNFKNVNYVKSGIHELIPIIEKNLKSRGNWIKLNSTQANKYPQIDFCFTNLAKIQTKSIVHNRILLDTDHFISNKGFYYEKFYGNEFIPLHKRVDDKLNCNTTIYGAIRGASTGNTNYPVVLKPDDGSLGKGIAIFGSCTKNDIDTHIAKYPEYNGWTITKLYVPRLLNGYVVSNRIYYLVRKMRIGNDIVVNGYWFDEFITYRAMDKYVDVLSNCISEDDLKKIFISTYDPNSTENFFTNGRVICLKNYIGIFTKSEYGQIRDKISKALTVITEQISNHITCSNDYATNYANELDTENKNITFHLYGVDCIIEDNIDIKLIEINGAPTIQNSKQVSSLYMNYDIIVNKILELTTDVLFKPLNKVEYGEEQNGCKLYGKFKDSDVVEVLVNREFIQCGSFVRKLRTPVYFYNDVCEKYPFVVNGFFSDDRKKKFQRIKNPHSNNIHLFYGARDLYIRDKSSDSYYDEILEWNNMQNGREAIILNKIQGITYFLASKNRMLDCLSACDFIPPSFIFSLTDNVTNLNTFIENIENIKKSNPNEYFIIKPVYGSQGKGIVILDDDTAIDIFIKHMRNVQKLYSYDQFVISVYINNPKLYNERKFNLRFYVLLHIAKLPTQSNNDYDVKFYILNDVLVYFAMLPYNIKIEDITKKINQSCVTDKSEVLNTLSLTEIKKTIHITNLQIVKDLATTLNVKIPLNNFVKTLDELEYDRLFIANVKKQGVNMIGKTIDKVKHNIRPLNRFVPNSSAFNLMAYDTMLDSNNKLHLIEINRGPDLHGLQITLGTEKVTKIFDELFTVVADKKSDNLKYFKQHDIVY